MYKFSEKTPQPLDQCSDETLCQLVAGGSREAEEALVTRYNRLVRTCARPVWCECVPARFFWQAATARI